MKLDIIAALTELLMLDEISENKKEGTELIKSYQVALDEEKIILLTDYLESGGQEEDFVFLLDENDLLFEELRESFEIKVHREEELREQATKKENLDKKEKLVEELRNLIQEEENIGKAFNKFKQIQEQWTEIGPIDHAQFSRVQSEYSRLRENFFYNINIFKELADNDKKKNLSLKKRCIEKIEILSKEKSITKLSAGIKPILAEWDEIGPTFHKDWEIIREEFWNIARDIFTRINHHFENQKLQQEKNMLAKQVIIDKARAINESIPTKHKTWIKNTEELKALQEEWKGTGFVSKNDNEKLWKEFRGLCDSFFNNKKKYYAELKTSFDANTIAKEAIINQAEFLKSRTDWRDTTEEFKKLQKEWSQIGPASPKKENTLWKQFRAHCDDFFNSKKNYFDTREEREKENLKLKEALIKKIESYEPTGNAKADIIALKEFSKEYKSIDHVPFKEKDRIHKAYSRALDDKYSSLKIEKAEKSKHLFLTKIELLNEAPNGKELIKKERNIIRDKIRRLNTDIIQFENNLGFFGRSEGAEKLKKEVEEKIGRNKVKVEELKKQLKLIDTVN